MKEHLARFGLYQMANAGLSSTDTIKIIGHEDLDPKEKDMDGHWQIFQNRVQDDCHLLFFIIQLYEAIKGNTLICGNN